MGDKENKGGGCRIEFIEKSDDSFEVYDWNLDMTVATLAINGSSCLLLNFNSEAILSQAEVRAIADKMGRLENKK